MKYEEFEKLTDDEQDQVRAYCTEMAWEWACDHHQSENVETIKEIAVEIQVDFLHEIDSKDFEKEEIL